MDLSQLGEFGLISRLSSRLQFQSTEVVEGIGDDCAVVTTGRGHYQVLTSDSLVESVHFDWKTHSPEQLGWKALAVNISDIAAMGGRPKFALISLGIPPSFPVRSLDKLYKGLNRACGEYKVDLVGGDTVASPRHFFINLALIGETFKKRVFTRSGARPGDAVLVTGTLGDSAAGLRILQSPGKRWQGPASIRNILIRRHRTPEPRVKTAWALARSRIRVTSMIDISDGLTQDLGHILKAAKAGAELWENAIPISKPLIKHSLKNKLPALEMALGGGEDYELLFTLPPEDVKKLNIGSITKAEQPVTQIGVITDGKGIRLKDQEGRTHSLQKPLGFNHFKNKS